MQIFRQRERAFGRNHGKPLNKNEKHLILLSIDVYNKNNRSSKQHIGPITRMGRKIAKALLYKFHNSRSGDCFPSFETIAESVGCTRSTVHKALRALEDAGIITWIHRIYRKTSVGNCQRSLRTSNAYIFTVPKLIRPNLLGKTSTSENRSGILNQDSLYKRRSACRERSKDLPGVSTLRISSYDNAQEQLRQLAEAAHWKSPDKAQVAGRSLSKAATRSEQGRGLWAASREAMIANPINASSDAAKQEALRRIRMIRFGEPQGCW